MPFAASAENSRNGEPGSTRRSMRSRATSLPRLRCRSTAIGPPPPRARARCSRKSSTSAAMAFALRSKSADRGSTRLASKVTPSDLSLCENIHPDGVNSAVPRYDAVVAASTTAPASYRPAGALDAARALEPYAGPWNRRLAAHLLRRAGFGGSPADVDRLAAMSPSAAVESLVRFPDASAEPAAPGLEVPP